VAVSYNSSAKQRLPSIDYLVSTHQPLVGADRVLIQVGTLHRVITLARLPYLLLRFATRACFYLP
jgi:hypothetical protein